MTSILAAARSGKGTVLRKRRTVPAIASEKSIELLQTLENWSVVELDREPDSRGSLGICAENDVVEINNYASNAIGGSLFKLEIAVKVQLDARACHGCGSSLINDCKHRSVDHVPP